MGSGGIEGVLTAAQELKVPLMELRQLALGLSDLSAADAKMRDTMVAVSERALRQVNDLAKMRGLTEGMYEMEPVVVRAACDEVLKEFDVQVGAQDETRVAKEDGAAARVAVKYHNRAKLVHANRELLKSVVYNFVLNAIQYAGQESRAELTVRDARDGVRIDVRDYGPCLPTDVWQAVKRGFIERPTTVAMRPGSSGLGLYIAAKFAKYMNAEMGAVRHRDGTSFYVDVPVSRQMSFWEIR